MYGIPSNKRQRKDDRIMIIVCSVLFITAMILLHSAINN